MIEHMGFLPICAVVEHGGAAPSDPAELERMWHELSVLEGSPPSQAETPFIAPALDYESDDVPRGSARISVAGPAEQWGVTELRIDGPSHGNPFVDVELSAEFASEDARHMTVGGFYDGEGTYRIRFQAPSAGAWTYVTASTARSLDGLRGAFQVGPPGPGNHGPVEVADRFHFAYRDGTRFLPFGTTAYAWTHQPAALQERTLADPGQLAFPQAPDVRVPEVVPLQHERARKVPVCPGRSRGLGLHSFRPAILPPP